MLPSSLDWDDAPLIKAWNKMEDKRLNKKRSKSNKQRKWKVGDCCKALYSVDNLYYEARIVDVNGDFCTVKFFGYDDCEDKDFTQLKESDGEEARMHQILMAVCDSSDSNSSMDESEDAAEETDVSTSRQMDCVNQVANDANMHEPTFNHPHYSASANVAYHAPPPPMQANLPMPPPVPMPYHSMPSPFQPQIPNPEDDPALSAAIVAWYMAGYYSGFYAGQKKAEPQSCCDCRCH